MRERVTLSFFHTDIPSFAHRSFAVMCTIVQHGYFVKKRFLILVQNDVLKCPYPCPSVRGFDTGT